MKLFSIVFTFIFFSMTNSVMAQSYDTEVISAEIYSDTIQRTGKLDYKRTLSLSFKSSGYLTRLNVDEGEFFSKGQLLASLDITELKEQKNSNYAQLLQAKREVKRMERLMDENLASGRDMDLASTAVETKRSTYQVSYYNLEKAQIYAPFAGVVLARNTELGELQSPGRPALKVAKLEWVVKVSLTGQEVSQVKLHQKVMISLESVGIVEGVISKIPAIASRENNLFTIEVQLPKLPLTSGMIAGQLAGVTIAVESDKFVYRLPIAALVAIDKQGQAIVLAQSQATTSFEHHNFEILQLDNKYVYLKANRNDDPLKIVTQGWQHYSTAEQ